MSVDAERMESQLDWLYRPVNEGWTDAVHLKDGTLDLCDVADMNDVLDVREENERRASAAVRAG